VFSADQLIIQRQKLDVSIAKLCRDQFEAAVFKIKSGYYIVPSPSTALLCLVAALVLQSLLCTKAG
jgi:hypothetical protein